jgi:hypothetical protein
MIIPVTYGLDVRNTVERQPSSFGNGTTLYVGGIGPGNYTTIQSAIDDALSGDTVFVFDDSSPYYENIIIDKKINLIGENRNTTMIICNRDTYAMVICADDVILSGFTIQAIDAKVNNFVINANEILVSNNNFINVSISSENNNRITISNNIFRIKKYFEDEIIFLSNEISCIIEYNTIYCSHLSDAIVISNCKFCYIRFNTIPESYTGIKDINGIGNNIYKNRITSASNGIYLINSNSYVEKNILTDCFFSIFLRSAINAKIIKNAFIEPFLTEIELKYSFFNKIEQNNFYGGWIYSVNSFFNKYSQNYWGRPRLLPKFILIGFEIYYGLFSLYIPLLDVDWNPAQEPYDIGGLV